MYQMLVVDDEYYIRLGIINAIDWSSINVEIIGEAADGASALKLARETRPDLILLDICMPILNGLELMEQFQKEQLNCDIIVLSGYDEFEYAQQCIKYGVHDYLLKPIDKQKLKDTVAKTCLARRNRRSLQNYQNLIHQEQSSLRNQFLLDVLLGNLNSIEKIKEKIDTLHIPLMDGFFVTLCLQLDDYNLLKEQLTPEDYNKFIAHTQTLLETHFSLGKNYLGIYTRMAPDEWGILLSFPDSPSEELCNVHFHSCVDQFLTDFKAFTPRSISISISPFTDLMTELPMLYQNARRLNRKFIPGQNSVIWPDNTSSQIQRSEIQGILNYVYNHYTEAITVQQVADALYISPSYLMHLFKKHTGKTFNTFLIEYRMEKAKELLQKPGTQIQSVAHDVGYSDVKYFNKLFKKYTSLTPTEYIKITYAKF